MFALFRQRKACWFYLFKVRLYLKGYYKKSPSKNIGQLAWFLNFQMFGFFEPSQFLQKLFN
jgi:hypothetical protein